MTIAAHTHTHRFSATSLSIKRAAKIRESQQLITREIGPALPIFAYPDGSPGTFNPDLMQVLREEGFKLTVTMVEGRALLKRDNPLPAATQPVAQSGPARFHLHLTPIRHRIRRKR